MKELKPIYSNQQSFYQKAYIKDIKGGKVLYSYMTPVASVIGGKQVITNKMADLTATTMKHIHEFLKQNGTDYPKAKLVKDFSGDVHLEGN